MSLLNADYEAFVAQHPKIPELIRDAQPHIKAIWPDASIVPELDTDPCGSQSVVVHIHTHDSDWKKQDEFDNRWWLDHCGEGEGLLQFMLSVTEP